MDTYYELLYDSGLGGRERLEGVNTVAAAKAVAKQVGKLASHDVSLVKVQEIDINAPARTRKSASS